MYTFERTCDYENNPEFDFCNVKFEMIDKGATLPQMLDSFVRFLKACGFGVDYLEGGYFDSDKTFSSTMVGEDNDN